MKLGRQLNILKQIDQGYSIHQVASFNRIQEARIREIYNIRAQILERACNCRHEDYFEPVNILLLDNKIEQKPSTSKSKIVEEEESTDNNQIDIKIEEKSLISTLEQELCFRKRKIDQVETDLKLKENQLEQSIEENNKLKKKLVKLRGIKKMNKRLKDANCQYVDEINELKKQLKNRDLKIDRLKIEKQIYLGEHMRLWNENKILKKN